MYIFKKLLHLFYKPKKKNYLSGPPTNRKDVSNIRVQDDVYFQVYWKVEEIGKGPAVVVFIFGEEILKFDCFGKDKGHYHIKGNKGAFRKRIFFEESNASEQIDKTIAELNNNLKIYLQLNNRQKVKELDIDQKNLEEALFQVRTNMVNFLETKPELSGI